MSAAGHQLVEHRSAQPPVVARAQGRWILLTALLMIGAVATVGPFVWMVLTSMKAPEEVLRLPNTLWPETFSFASYQAIFDQMPIVRFLLNSVIVAILSIVPALFFGALAGYAFAKLEFRGRELCFFFVIAVLMVPFEAKLVPLYLHFAKADLTNTYLGLAGPGMFSAIGVFMMRQFMAQVPDDYLDAARIDGASELGVFWRIALPLMRPALFTLAIITFISVWNSFLWPLADELNGTSFVGNQAIEWLRQRSTMSPFFLHVGFTAPHSPIAPEAGFVEMYREYEETPAWGNAAPSGWLPEGRRGYRAMISHVDSYVGRIVDCLTERGLAENTIVVYVSDHGEMAGDHGRYSKTCFFEGAARVPMIIAGAGLPNQEPSMALVETIDLGRTLCDLGGIEPHPLDQGRSLAPLLREEIRTHRETVYCEMGCDKMLRDEQYKLMWGDPGLDTRELGRLHLDKPVTIPPSPARLYDLQADPHELSDLADDGTHQALLSAMLAKLLTRLNENTQTQPNKSRGEYRPLRH